jgi:protein-tyrosine phosphatase
MSRWWIDEPKLLGCSNLTDEQLEDLYQEGFRTIISLLDEHEQTPYYNLRALEAKGFRRYSIPVPDFTAPTLADFQKFIHVVGESLKQGKVLVHCQGGTGRTGTMAAAYWMKKGLSAKEAIKKVRKVRIGAIEMSEQEDSLYELEASTIKEVFKL